MIPEWFWTLDYLLAPFLVAIMLMAVTLFIWWQGQKSANRQTAVLERIAEALEKRDGDS